MFKHSVTGVKKTAIVAVNASESLLTDLDKTVIV